MEHVPNHPRSHRRSFERTYFERKSDQQRFSEIFKLQSQDSSHFNVNCEGANMSLDLSLKSSQKMSDPRMEIKRENLPALRRYFCIFCKMDFVIAEEFLDHLEALHPQGSFVLVKRDAPQTIVLNSPEHEEPSNNMLLPDLLENQIKIEPISEDELDREQPPCEQSSFEEGNEGRHNNNNIIISNNNVLVPLEDHQNDPNHQLMVLSNPSISDGPGSYSCAVCSAKFVYKNNLKSHLKRHLGIYPYVCFCGKRYQFKCKLNKHIEQAHAKIKNFLCPVPECPKKYFTRNDLAFHISVTHRERQEIPCSICKKVFNSPKSLQIHGRKYHRNQES